MYLEVNNVKKSYGEGGSFTEVLRGVSLSVGKGDMCVIQGASGSGKSTLLNGIGGLDLMDSGSIRVDGEEICGLSRERLSDYRRENLGFVFQFYNLVPNLTVKENIQVCEYLSGHPLRLVELLDTLGLAEHQNKFPSQLSGGQQQRVLLARALCAAKEILVLDEPMTGLDPMAAAALYENLRSLNQDGMAVVMVTHDIQNALTEADFVLHMSEGEYFYETTEEYKKRIRNC